jgi:hypothetical protein
MQINYTWEADTDQKAGNGAWIFKNWEERGSGLNIIQHHGFPHINKLYTTLLFTDNGAAQPYHYKYTCSFHKHKTCLLAIKKRKVVRDKQPST